MTTHGRIAIAAALTLGVTLWVANGVLRGADDVESGESVATIKPERRVSKAREVGFVSEKPSERRRQPATMASDLSKAFNADSSTRYESEVRLDEAGEAARRHLVERQAIRLRELADRAERSGNTERARLLRLRVAYLESRGQESEHSP